MAISKQHFLDVTKGYERMSSGLWTHKGSIDTASLRVTKAMYPSNGAGIEFTYANNIGTIYPYDRDVGSYTDLTISGRNITLLPQGGKVSLPANTAQATIGSYVATLNWTQTTNAWTETPVAVTATCTGVPCRIDFGVTMRSLTAGQDCYFGWGIDGAVQNGLGVMTAAAANGAMPFNATFNYTPSAGSHRFAAFTYTSTSSPMANNVNVYIFVTEQRT